MSYTLVIGNKNYSSWSMRAWLLLRFVGAAFTEQKINLYSRWFPRAGARLGWRDRPRSRSNRW
jgi:glutathione S-transferase